MQRRSFLTAIAGLFAAPLLPWRKATTRGTSEWPYGIRGIVDDGTEMPTIFTAGPYKFGGDTFYFTENATYRLLPESKAITYFDGTQWK